MIFSKLIHSDRHRAQREAEQHREELVQAYRVGVASGKVDFAMGLPSVPRPGGGRVEDKVEQAIRMGRRAGYEEALRAEADLGVQVLEQLLGEVSP